MKVASGLVACALASVLSGQAHAAAYNFDITYSGGGNAVLNVGSDDPVGTTLLAGDSFMWSIRALGDSYWDVITGGNFFPLMAFGVQEYGARTGSFDLVLRNNGGSVFSLSEVDSEQLYVHMGTNTVALNTGLKFDEMYLSYSLTSATEDPDLAADPFNLLAVGSTPTGLLPILGAPELNQFSPGIAYVNAVPEPESYALMFAGLGVVGWVSRRKRQATSPKPANINT